MNEDEILEILKKDPGNSVFAEYAEALHKQGNSETAIIVCLRGLSANPSNAKGRLLLSKVYYDLGFKPFCIDQLKILLNYLPESKSVRRLLEKLSPQEFNRVTVNLTKKVETVAEAEFDFSEIELIEESDK